MRELADQGDADAQTNLDSMYIDGRSGTQDYAAPMRWYRKAADQGDGSAQTNLGVMYDKGQGVTQDYKAPGALMFDCICSLTMQH